MHENCYYSLLICLILYELSIIKLNKLMGFFLVKFKREREKWGKPKDAILHYGGFMGWAHNFLFLFPFQLLIFIFSSRRATYSTIERKKTGGY